jgi:hypothetical protein
MCCGQKRSGLKASGTADAGVLKLLYDGHASVNVRGSVTGQLYQFSRLQPVQTVDSRDATSILRTRLFRQVR